jgi:hypothetical protein
MIALRSLARPRHPQRGDRDPDHDAAYPRPASRPALLATKGVGVVTAAQLLITSGQPRTHPQQSSVRSPDRRRPDPGLLRKDQPPPPQPRRGPTRELRIHTIALVRMTCDDRTKSYIKKRPRGQDHPGSPPVPQTTTRQRTVPHHHESTSDTDVSDLRSARLARGLTLQVADHFGVWPTHIYPSNAASAATTTLAQSYRDWLKAI